LCKKSQKKSSKNSKKSLIFDDAKDYARNLEQSLKSKTSDAIKTLSSTLRSREVGSEMFAQYTKNIEQLQSDLCNKEEELLRARITESIFLGLNTHYTVELETGARAEIIQESTISNILNVGEEISLKINTDKVNVFTEDGEKNILISADGKGVQV